MSNLPAPGKLKINEPRPPGLHVTGPLRVVHNSWNDGSVEAAELKRICQDHGKRFPLISFHPALLCHANKE